MATCEGTHVKCFRVNKTLSFKRCQRKGFGMYGLINHARYFELNDQGSFGDSIFRIMFMVSILFSARLLLRFGYSARLRLLLRFGTVYRTTVTL